MKSTKLDLLALALLLLALGVRVVALSQLWGWFAEPLVGVALGPLNVLGLALLWYVAWGDVSESDGDSAKAIELSIKAIVVWGLSCVFGWVVHLGMA